jgi:hypothetical protein
LAKYHDSVTNPFNAVTTIAFDLSEDSQVKLSNYKIDGRLARELVNRPYTSCSYSVTFDASDLSSGVYLYRLFAGSHFATKRMLLVK